jgi:hypothetical protein
MNVRKVPKVPTSGAGVRKVQKVPTSGAGVRKVQKVPTSGAGVRKVQKAPPVVAKVRKVMVVPPGDVEIVKVKKVPHRRGRPPAPSDVRTLDEGLSKLLSEETGRLESALEPEEQGRLARELLDVFFNIWIRFAVDIGKELRMSPWQWDFIIYEGGKKYRFRDSFNFAHVNDIILEEAGFPFRHSLKGELRTLGGNPYVTVSIVLEEGRQYEMASAVTAHNSYIIYNEPVKKFTLHGMKEALAEPLRVWIRSAIRGDPALLWDYCHDQLRKGR